MTDLLVKNGFSLTVAPAGTTYERGAVAIEGERVVAIGPQAERPARRVVDAPRNLGGPSGGAPLCAIPPDFRTQRHTTLKSLTRRNSLSQV